MARPDWDPRHLPDLHGRRFLITGSNAGLGYFSAEQLAAAGATVIMTGRNPNRLAAARAAVNRRIPDAAADGRVQTLLLDTSNFGSVRAAAATARTMGGLDGLLLNAGIVHPPKQRETTADGHEIVFATNALGHYALAGELLTTLAAASGRIVWLGSMSTSLSPYDPIDPQLIDHYSGWRAYVQSKVATSVLGFEADRRLRAAAVPVSSVVAHPGYAISGRTAGIVGVNEPTKVTRFADNLQAADRPVEGARRVAARPGAGRPRGRGRGRSSARASSPEVPRRSRSPSKIVRSEEIATRLWRVCEDATGVRWPFAAAAAPGADRARSRRRPAGSRCRKPVSAACCFRARVAVTAA